jgi:D-3-phosphoglycerate dehydrogenase
MHQRPVVVIPGDDPPLVGRSRYLDQLREFAEVRLYSDRPANEAEMLDRLKSADVLLNSRSAVKVSGDVLNQLPNLKMIAVCGIGYDSIDIEAASQRGIVVSNIPGRTATVVAEHAFGLMLAVARRMASMTEQLRAGQWSSELGMSLLGKRVGVIGTGNIGLEMIRLCATFGTEVVAWSFHPDENKAAEFGFRYVPLEELLATSDVISLHVRLSEETRGMIGQSELQQMKPSSILINTARAAVVDTSALASAVNRGHLFGAGVDVYDVEPAKTDNLLLKCRNVVLTPHSADQTPEGIDLLTQGCVENIRAFLDGKPQSVVNASELGLA